MTLGVLPRMRHQGIGDMHVFSLLDSVGSTREPRGMLSGWVDGMAKGLDWLSPDYLDPQGRMVMAYQSFLLRTPDLSILIDCAVGEDGTFPARPDWHQRKSNWMAHLGQAGLTPDDVDVVFLTHLHPDHTGWLTRLDAGEWTPTFPRARHVTSACEIEHWSANHASVPVMGASWSDSVAPVLARFETVATGDTLAPGLEVVDSGWAFARHDWAGVGTERHGARRVQRRSDAPPPADGASRARHDLLQRSGRCDRRPARSTGTVCSRWHGDVLQPLPWRKRRPGRARRERIQVHALDGWASVNAEGHCR